MTVCSDCLDRFSVDKTHISCRKTEWSERKRRREPSVKWKEIISGEEEEQNERKGIVCALLCVRGGDRAVGEDAFRGRIHTAGVHKEADRPCT